MDAVHLDDVGFDVGTAVDEGALDVTGAVDEGALDVTGADDEGALVTLAMDGAVVVEGCAVGIADGTDVGLRVGDAVVATGADVASDSWITVCTYEGSESIMHWPVLGVAEFAEGRGMYA